MLEAFFSPIDKSIVKTYSKSKGLLGSDIRIHGKAFPNIEGVQVAIIGLGNSANMLRKELYGLHSNIEGLCVADFGNLNHDAKENTVNSGLRECLIALREYSIIPIIIGENFNLSQAMLQSINYSQVDSALVSPFIAFNEEDLAFKLHAKKKLFHTSFIGYQTYLNSLQISQDTGNLFSEFLRLGEARGNITEVEPLLRQADIFEFDLRAIRYSDFKSSTDCLPNGFFNHEACAIAKYAGISNTISTYLINQLNLNENSSSDAKQVSQMLWYILDGINNRFNDIPQLNNKNFTIYKCHAHSGEDMLFLYSELTGRWWMQIPQMGKPKKTALKFIGCTEEDHRVAEQGEIPEKWFRALS
jgi:formiminoglutamase